MRRAGFAILFSLATCACDRELVLRFTSSQPDVRLASLTLAIEQGGASLHDDVVHVDAGFSLPNELRVLVRNQGPLTIRAEGVDLSDATHRRTVERASLSEKAVEIDLSEAVACPPPPLRPQEVSLFDDSTHDRDDFTYWSGPPLHVTGACSGTVAAQLSTSRADDGIGLFTNTHVPEGARYRRLSLRLWSDTVGTVKIGLVKTQPFATHWLPTQDSLHEVGPTWRSFVFEVPDTIPNTEGIHVLTSGVRPPFTVRMDDVRVIPR